MEINRLIAVLVFPLFLLAMPICAFAEDRKDIRGAIRDVRGEMTAVKSEIKEFMLRGFGVTFAGIN
ncbi:MAG: hypothetical protein HZB37_07980 [Planctomycetes bacterium]|nr:hypothetical protein [Planctomycetota bacterium]